MTTVNAQDGLGIQGYDPVSYFDGGPEKGNDDITAEYKGVTYRFTSEDHRDTFNANPEKYLPAYGGYCAVAMSEGNILTIDPLNYLIDDDTLYLFSREGDDDILPMWQENALKLRTAADERWDTSNYSE